MNRAQRVDEKNRVIFLFIMLTPRVEVTRMSKNGPYFVFSADNSIKSVTVWAKYLSELRNCIICIICAWSLFFFITDLYKSAFSECKVCLNIKFSKVCVLKKLALFSMGCVIFKDFL